MPDPKPVEPVGAFPGKCAVVESDPCCIENSDFLEPEGQVSGIAFEQRKVLVGERPDIVGKLTVMEPEIRVGKVIQSGVQRPAS